MQRQLAAVIESLNAAQSRLRALTDKLSDKNWGKRPAPNRWYRMTAPKKLLALLEDC